MAKINQIFVAISLILIISFVPNRISCKPTGRNSDLIDGNDFLSLFLDQNNQPNLNDETNYDDLEKSDNIYSSNNKNNNNINNKKNTNKNIDLNDDINPLETIMSNEEELLTQDSSNYGQRLRERIQNQKYIPKLNHQSSNNNNNHNQYTQINNSDKLTSEITTTDDDFIENSEKIISVESPTKKQIIKMVTSGSKIVFLEEMTPLNDRTYHKNINNISNNSNKINVTSDNNSKFNNNTKNDSDDIQVISISVSSTVGRSKKQHQQNSRLQSQQHRKSNNFMKLSSTIIPTINDNFTDDDDLLNNTSNRSHVKKTDFINRSHKSEFSIEESEPVTQNDNMSDSVNGESTNIHSILAPPQQSVINQTHNNIPININHRSDVSNRDISNINTKTEATNRMERKQDKLVPFQTVIYHDTGFNKDGSAQPRSISYSSVGQSIDQLNAWKDLEGLLEAKENVSESLRKPPLSSSSSSNQGYHHHPTVSPKTNHHHPKVYSQPEKVYSEPAKFYSEPSKMYGEPSKFYSEPSKIYSEPAKVYGQPEKQYGEPAKIYSEPSKVYSEPAKVYSEPAKVYSEPSKVYWPRPTTTTTTTTSTTTTTVSPLTDRNQNSYNKLRNSSSLNSNSRRVIFNLDKLPYDLLNAPESSKRLLVPDLNSGRRLHSSSINVDNKNSNDDIDYDNNSNENDQNNQSKYQHQTNHFHQQHQYHQQQQENHHQSSQNDNLPISQMNIKNNNLNYQHIQHNNNNNNNRGNNIQGRNQQQSLLHHHSSSDDIIYNNRPDLVTDNPKYLSVTETTKNLYTPTPEQNYEIEESVSVMTNGRANGIVQTALQPTRSSIKNIGNGGSSIASSSTNNSDDSKVGYVVEGRNFRKYRVEEKTDDGFIVGEYGVVSHNDGGVRGVRYTADSNINPTLIHQALMKFLSL